MAISQLTPKQNQKIKSPIIDINHHLNQVLPAFDNLNKELSSGFRLVDIFSDCFSFNIVKHKDAKARIAYLNKLENIYRASKNNPDILFIIIVIVMNIEWDYSYYQPWSDNEWLVDEMLAM